MGFFDVMGKILAGKPVYGPENTNAPTQPAVEGNNGAGTVVPVVRVTRVESPIANGRMDVNLEIKNESPVPVWIDKVQLMGVVCDLNDDLPAGGSHEFHVYSGAAPQNEAYRSAEIQYYTEDRNYFLARHDIVYEVHSDGLHVKELRLVMPIKNLR